VNKRKVTTSTHNVALSALLYLYKEVLATELAVKVEVGRPSVRLAVHPAVQHREASGMLAPVVFPPFSLC
jgi:hypothetical protein